MNDTFLPGSRFFDWNDVPLLALPKAPNLVLNCAFDPPRAIALNAPLGSAREISLQEFERLRAVHRAAWQQHLTPPVIDDSRVHC